MNRILHIFILAFTAIPVFNIVRWLYLGYTEQHLSHEGLVEKYMAFYPSFIGSAFGLTLLNIVLLLTSFGCIIKLYPQTTNHFSKIFRTISVVNLVLVVWNVWSLL
jgi:hypothetical protein